MTKQENTTLNMVTFIWGPSLLLLDKLNLDTEADMCEQLNEDTEMHCRIISAPLTTLQDVG